MKKIFTLAALGSLAAVSCGIDGVMAQATQSAVVGNPGSSNVLIIEEGYEAVAPAAGSVNSVSPQSPDWSQEGNVDVAPLSGAEQTSPAAADAYNAAAGNNGAASTPSAVNQGTVNVNESVTEIATPDSAAMEVDETISN